MFTFCCDVIIRNAKATKIVNKSGMVAWPGTCLFMIELESRLSLVIKTLWLKEKA